MIAIIFVRGYVRVRICSRVLCLNRRAVPAFTLGRPMETRPERATGPVEEGDGSAAPCVECAGL